MEHLEQTIDVILAVGRPFIPVDCKETDVSQQRTAILAGLSLGGLLGANVPGDVVEQALQKGPQLAVAGRPIAARVRLDRLIKMPV